ncbi:8993_t:CDS:2 [Ambispora leptoticha]|uniref:8993_t:CDS:1 n=1 Tax=Ambispora leptoticha TaxID=144679 RepID=A0A9N9EZ21_9GLOM|nr:8993_t:CDS:2 [Ambispora leptoticha]
MYFSAKEKYLSLDEEARTQASSRQLKPNDKELELLKGGCDEVLAAFEKHFRKELLVYYTEQGKQFSTQHEKVEYGDDDYSEIKLEYDVDKKLERLQPHKDLVLQIFADNKTREEGHTLVIPQSWNAKKTILQDIKDRSNEGIKNIGDKTGSDTLKQAANEEVNLPGVKKEDVKIEVEENIVKISGERKEEKKQDDAKQHYSEIFYGKFYREFALPTLVKKEKIKAHYENGVLSIVAPKDTQSQAHRINIDYEETLREIKKEAIEKIKRYLGYADLSQAEFSNLVREVAATAPDLQEYVEKVTNFERTIENMRENSEIELFVENMIKIIDKTHRFKLDKEYERTKNELDQDLERTRKECQAKINETIRQNNQEREEWWRKYNADNKKKEEEAKKILEGLQKRGGKDSNTEIREFTERNQKDDIDKVERELRKRKVSEQKLNQRLGVSD